MNEINVMDLIDKLYSEVTDAWGVPLGNDKCIVERDSVLKTLNEIKNALPAELAEAKRLVSARDEFIGSAKREAEAIRKNAEDRARAMLEEEEVYRKAKAESAEMVANAEYKSKELRRIASEYVDDLLGRTETTVAEALRAINLTRASFLNKSSEAVQAGGTETEEEEPVEVAAESEE